MTSTWMVSPILVPLILEEKQHHSGMVVGTIGDTAHQAEANSDHDPDEWHFVAAGDFMIGPHFTATDAEWLFQRIVTQIRMGDKRCAYAIYKRRIVSSTVSPGSIRTYSGTDPHTNHVHVSVPHGSQPHPTTSWHIYQEDTVTPDDIEAIAAAVAGKLGADLNNDKSGVAIGERRQDDAALADNFAALNLKLDTIITKLNG